MRKASRAVVVALLTFLGAIALGVAAALTAAITFAATALIVPGTGTHNITTVTGYKENAADRFIGPATQATPFFCTSTNGCDLVGIPYPASFWPIPLPGWCPGLTCDTWNVSVGQGVANLNSELINQLANPTPNNQQIDIFGYSQGGAVVSDEMYNLASLPQSIKDRITVTTIGNIKGPQGLWTRFSFLPTIPILNITFCCSLPTDIGIKSYNYNFEYDPVGDAPAYLFNPIAWLNAIAAFQYVHGYYLVPNSNDPTGVLPYGYTPTTLDATIQQALATCDQPGSACQTYQDGKFILIPWQGTLPIYQPFMDLANATGLTPLVKPVVDFLTPATKFLIDLGYDRTSNPGIPQTLRLFPIINPFTATIGFVAAVGEGFQNLFNDLDGTPLAPLVPLAPLTTTAPSPGPPVSTFAATQTEQPSDNSVVVNTPKTDPVPADVDTQTLVDNSNQNTPADKTPVTNPFELLQLPQSNNNSSTTTPNKPNGWKPGAVVQGFTSAVKDVINGFTKPFTHKPTTGSQPSSTPSGQSPSSGSQAAA